MNKEFLFEKGEISQCRDRLISAFGLAKRAGRCVLGTQMCVDSIREETARLVIAACDLSDNTNKKLMDSCSYHNVDIIFLDCNMAYLGEKLGKKNGTSCAAILDESFVNICRKIYSEIRMVTTEVQQ